MSISIIKDKVPVSVAMRMIGSDERPIARQTVTRAASRAGALHRPEDGGLLEVSLSWVEAVRGPYRQLGVVTPRRTVMAK